METIIGEEKKQNKFYKVENFVNDENEVITAKTEQVAGDSNLSDRKTFNGKTTYVGTVPLMARTPQGVMQVPFEFEFPENMSLVECFEKFEETAKAKIAEFKKEQEDKNRIIPATSMPPSGPNLSILK